MIKHSMDLVKKKPVTPEFESDEELIKMFSASYDVGNRAVSSWRLCNIYLTTKRLILGQAKKILKDLRFENIKSATIVERPWIASKKIPQIRFDMKSGKICYVAVNNATGWLKDMAELAGWKLDDSNARPWKKPRGNVEII